MDYKKPANVLYLENIFDRIYKINLCYGSKTYFHKEKGNKILNNIHHCILELNGQNGTSYQFLKKYDIPCYELLVSTDGINIRNINHMKFNFSLHEENNDYVYWLEIEGTEPEEKEIPTENFDYHSVINNFSKNNETCYFTMSNKQRFIHNGRGTSFSIGEPFKNPLCYEYIDKEKEIVGNPTKDFILKFNGCQHWYVEQKKDLDHLIFEIEMERKFKILSDGQIMPII